MQSDMVPESPTGSFTARNDSPEFTDIKVMGARIHSMLLGLKEASANGIRLQKKLSEIQSQLHTCIGRTVIWPWKVAEIQPAGFSQYGHISTRTRVLLRPMGYANVPGTIASEVSNIRLEQDSVHDMDPNRDTRDATGWEYLEVRTNISEEYATRISKDDIIKIRGTITICEPYRGVCIRIGNPMAIDPNEPNAASDPINHSSNTDLHEIRKARAATLIAYITTLGNTIDQLNASGQNPRNYWRNIIDAQNELLGIYHAELPGAAGDPEATQTLQSNITKINRGRKFAWNALRQCPR